MNFQNCIKWINIAYINLQIDNESSDHVFTIKKCFFFKDFILCVTKHTWKHKLELDIY